MTVAAVLASLIPILWESGVGSDVMKPIAAPIVGGMITSTIHVLILVPVFFVMLKTHALRRGSLKSAGEGESEEWAEVGEPERSKWVEHLRANGFAVKVQEVNDTAGYERQYRVPRTMESCHTAVVSGYTIEGHVPAADIKRLLNEKPKAVGLAVPGMPVGSPWNGGSS
jgi:hypothetical protein